MMCLLNFQDLIYMVIEYDIETVKTQLRMEQQRNNSNQGVSVKRASNAEILKMHGRSVKINGDS